MLIFASHVANFVHQFNFMPSPNTREDSFWLNQSAIYEWYLFLRILGNIFTAKCLCVCVHRHVCFQIVLQIFHSISPLKLLGIYKGVSFRYAFSKDLSLKNYDSWAASSLCRLLNDRGKTLTQLLVNLTIS